MVKLPADGTYYVHLGDTACQGGEEYTYRLRLGAPRPNFAIRVVPSSIGFRSKGTAREQPSMSIRKERLRRPHRAELEKPAGRILRVPHPLLPGAQTANAVGPENRSDRKPGSRSRWRVEGRAKSRARGGPRRGSGRRPDAGLPMAAPGSRGGAQGVVVDPSYVPREEACSAPLSAVGRPRPSPWQRRLTRQGSPSSPRSKSPDACASFQLLFEEGLLTDAFYNEKVAECEAAQ